MASTCEPTFLTGLAAALTPAIALLAVFVAVAQWRIARNKLTLDLFDRRWQLYQTTVEFIHSNASKPIIDDEVIDAYVVSTRGAEWLLDRATARYLNKLRAQSEQMFELQERIKMPAVGVDVETQKKERRALRHWFRNQQPVLAAKFDGFMTIR